MAAAPGIDLHDRGARPADALAIICSRLVALNHIERQLASEISNRALEQCRLASAWRTDDVERKNLAPGEPRSVLRRRRIVFCKNPRLHIKNIYARTALGVMWIGMSVGGISIWPVVMVSMLVVALNLVLVIGGFGFPVPL